MFDEIVVSMPFFGWAALVALAVGGMAAMVAASSVVTAVAVSHRKETLERFRESVRRFVMPPPKAPEETKLVLAVDDVVVAEEVAK